MLKEKIVGKHKVAGTILECTVCHYNDFWTCKTLMNTPGMTFLGIEWVNKNARNYICDSCGYVFWFLNN